MLDIDKNMEGEYTGIWNVMLQKITKNQLTKQKISGEKSLLKEIVKRKTQYVDKLWEVWNTNMYVWRISTRYKYTHTHSSFKSLTPDISSYEQMRFVATWQIAVAAVSTTNSYCGQLNTFYFYQLKFFSQGTKLPSVKHQSTLSRFQTVLSLLIIWLNLRQAWTSSMLQVKPTNQHFLFKIIQ